ncbi:MAG: hypothetical protein KDA45_16895, partial [Planctomycetales bacterium]|nr:hypothetical protein [Planctomycetales bacterium]
MSIVSILSRNCTPAAFLPIVGWLVFYGVVGGLPQRAQAEGPDEWHTVAVPDAWRRVPTGELSPIDGYSWYRCLVRIPKSWADADLTLYVESLDDARASYVNGINVGTTGVFPPQFRSGLGEKGQYAVSADDVMPGEFHTVAIRVYQSDPRPNFNVAPPVLLNAEAKQAIRMDGKWQYRPGDDAAWSRSTAAEWSLESLQAAVEEDRDRGIFTNLDEVDDIDRYVARRKGDNDPYSPQDAEKNFQTPADLEFQLVLSEPDIAQPLFMN